MVKVFKSPQKISSKKRISLRLPVQMLNELNNCMEAVGKNKKERSHYISQAIIELEATGHFEGLVAENWLERGDNCSIQISLNQEAELALNTIEKVCNKKQESKTDLISAIVRTAIIQKILSEDI